MARVTLVGVFLLTLVLAGCSALTNLINLGDEIEDAGYRSVSCQSNSVNGYTVLDISAQSTGDEVTDEDGDRIAEVVWTKYDGTFDELRVTVNGEQVLAATEDELTDTLGERPSGVVTGGSEGTDFTMVIVVTVVAAVLLTGLCVLVWWRGRKPPPPVAPPPGYPYPPNVYPPPQR